MSTPASEAASPATGPWAWFERALGVLMAIPVALIVVLTFVDVFGRYVFSAPLRGSIEIIEQAMALVIFAALPLVTRHRGHISVGLLDNVGSAGVRRLRGALCDGVAALGLALIAWRLVAQSLHDLKAGAASVVLGLQHAPLGFAMAALAGASCVAALGLAWGKLVHTGDKT